jgi:hypothetical protein
MKDLVIEIGVLRRKFILFDKMRGAARYYVELSAALGWKLFLLKPEYFFVKGTYLNQCAQHSSKISYM